MKKLLLIAILSVISVVGLFALDGIVTWTWYENDPDVEFYRYQVDGEEDGRWTVVDWSVNEVSLTLDVSVLHTLYLQQSYDGEIWSPSSATDSEIYTESEGEEPYEEEEFPEEFEPEAPPAEEQPAADEEVVAATVIEDEIYVPVVEEEVYKPFVFVDFGIGYMNSIPDSASPKTIGFNASYYRTFFKAGIFDIGVKGNVGIYTSKQLFMNPSQMQLQAYLNAQALASTVIGNCDVWGAIGPDLGFTFINDSSVKAGMSIEIGVRYHRYKNFSIGFAISDHYYLIPVTKMANRLELKAFLSKAF